MRIPPFPALTALLALSITVPLQAESTKSGGWERVDSDEGIVTWKHEVPGQVVPGFRGQVVIDAPLEKIRAAIEDTTTHTKWMHRCAESTELKKLGENESLLYNRTDSPWPVWDRDVVLKAKVTEMNGGEDVLLAFQNTQSELKPKKDDVVRMPKLVGFYKLSKLKDGKTKVVYQVEADVGGSLPDWLVKRVVKEMPYETLAHLRERVTGK